MYGWVSLMVVNFFCKIKADQSLTKQRVNRFYRDFCYFSCLFHYFDFEFLDLAAGAFADAIYPCKINGFVFYTYSVELECFSTTHLNIYVLKRIHRGLE